MVGHSLQFLNNWKMANKFKEADYELTQKLRQLIDRKESWKLRSGSYLLTSEKKVDSFQLKSLTFLRVLCNEISVEQIVHLGEVWVVKRQSKGRRHAGWYFSASWLRSKCRLIPDKWEELGVPIISMWQWASGVRYVKEQFALLQSASFAVATFILVFAELFLQTLRRASVLNVYLLSFFSLIEKYEYAPMYL